jgi:hypothetical protein
MENIAISGKAGGFAVLTASPVKCMVFQVVMPCCSWHGFMLGLLFNPEDHTFNQKAVKFYGICVDPFLIRSMLLLDTAILKGV